MGNNNDVLTNQTQRYMVSSMEVKAGVSCPRSCSWLRDVAGLFSKGAPGSLFHIINWNSKAVKVTPGSFPNLEASFCKGIRICSNVGWCCVHVLLVTSGKELMFSALSVCLMVSLYVCLIKQTKKTIRFLLNLVEWWAMGQERSHYIWKWIRLRGLVQESFSTFFNIARYWFFKLILNLCEKKSGIFREHISWGVCNLLQLDWM